MALVCWIVILYNILDVQLHGLHRGDGGGRCEEVARGLVRFGLAVGARKMIDHEYEHAVDSITNNVYVRISPCRSHTAMILNTPSASASANSRSASVAICLGSTMTSTSPRSTIPPAQTVPARSLCSFPHVRKSVACTGWSAGRTSMFTLGDLPASNHNNTQM